MKMEYLCPNCGAKVTERSGLWNSYLYGSKIRKCKKCDTDIFDNRWKEVAWEGFNPTHMRQNKFCGLWALIAIIVAVLGGVWKYYEEMYLYTSSILSDSIIAVAIMVTLYCIVKIFRIKTGIEERANQKFMEESKARMQDETYLKKLRDHGLRV